MELFNNKTATKWTQNTDKHNNIHTFLDFNRNMALCVGCVVFASIVGAPLQSCRVSRTRMKIMQNRIILYVIR